MGEGEFLHADEMQAGAGRGLLAEQLPGAEEVQAGAEAGLADDQATAFGQRGEALRQLVAVEEDMAGLGHAGFGEK